MKLLFISPRFPYPPHKGDQLVLYQRLLHLSKKHDIFLLTMCENKVDIKNIDMIRPYCKKIFVVYLPKLYSLLNILFGFFSGLPFQVLYFYSKKFRNLLYKVLSENNIDLIHAFTLRVVPYLDSLTYPKVVDLIDSMQLNSKRTAELEKFPMKMVYQEEFRRVRRYERNIAKNINFGFVVSRKDKELISGDNVVVMPNGVDTVEFVPKNGNTKSSVVVFSGNMSYSPNIFAVKWFVDNCFDRIRMEIPSISFVIVGANPKMEIRNLSKKNGIVVTGYVDSICDILCNANVAIAPMQSGSGMQNKILEAMACSLPVVTTSIGLGDIQACVGRDIFVSDSIDGFVEKVIVLLKDSNKAHTIGENARRFVVKEHSWEKSANEIEKKYRELI